MELLRRFWVWLTAETAPPPDPPDDSDDWVW